MLHTGMSRFTSRESRIEIILLDPDNKPSIKGSSLALRFQFSQYDVPEGPTTGDRDALLSYKSYCAGSCQKFRPSSAVSWRSWDICVAVTKSYGLATVRVTSAVGAPFHCKVKR